MSTTASSLCLARQGLCWAFQGVQDWESCVLGASPTGPLSALPTCLSLGHPFPALQREVRTLGAGEGSPGPVGLWGRSHPEGAF